MVLKNLPPLAGLTFNRNAYPTLTRGARFCRRYAAVFGCASRDILDRRYSRKARVHGIEFVSEFLTQDTRTDVVFPHIVVGGGYTTQGIVFGSPGSGKLWFYSQDGQVLGSETLQRIP